MTELTAAEEKKLKQVYYTDGNIVGRDSLYRLCQDRGIWITRDKIDKWLDAQQVHQLTKKQQKPKDFRGITSNHPFSFIEADLVSFDNVPILTVIDVFSRKAYATSLNDKKANTVTKAITEIIKSMPMTPKLLLTDNGPEFKSTFDKAIKKMKIKHIYGIAGVPQSQGIIERFNGTFKNQIERNLMIENKTIDNDMINKIVDAYNERKHETIGIAPNKAIEKPNLRKVREATKSDKLVNNFKAQDDINEGDTVRLALIKSGPFDKSILRWSEELYTVQKVMRPRKNPLHPIKYKIKDNKGEIIAGWNNRESLQKIEKVEGPRANVYYIVEKLVERIKEGRKVFYIVKWKNYSHAENTKEPRAQLMQDVPDLVLEYERTH